MVSDAESIGQKYLSILAKSSAPSSKPETKQLLNETSSWISIDLNNLKTQPGQSVLETLSQDGFWQILQDIGIDGIQIENLKAGGQARTGLGIDSKWGAGWAKIQDAARSRGIAIGGELIGASTGVGIDFEMALKNVVGYRELYHLIEIDRADWQLLPNVALGKSAANIAWLQLDSLYKRGYVNEAAHPYVKESAWNATAKIKGNDGVERRWIYRKENQNDPQLLWLSSTFGADRIASADSLDSIYRLGQKILKIDAKIPFYAKETAALWIRKIGGYSAAATSGTLLELQNAPTDLAYDAPTRPALLHALVSEDAEALRLIYNLYLQSGIAPMRLIHSLEPIETASLDWAEFLSNPTKRYIYREEKITGELLRDRLMKEDMLRLNALSRYSLPISTWTGYCALRFEKQTTSEEMAVKQEIVQKAHLLLAFTYAMQPGIFSLSLLDLMGALSEDSESIDLMGPNPGALYASLPCQMQTPRSFASQLKKILEVRSQSQISRGELISVPEVQNRGTLLLIHRLPESRFFQLLAVNFSTVPVQEKIKLKGIEDTWAIELMSGLTADKGFDQDAFSFDLPPLAGKVFLFQPKYYD